MPGAQGCETVGTKGCLGCPCDGGTSGVIGSQQEGAPGVAGGCRKEEGEEGGPGGPHAGPAILSGASLQAANAGVNRGVAGVGFCSANRFFNA